MLQDSASKADKCCNEDDTHYAETDVIVLAVNHTLKWDTASLKLGLELQACWQKLPSYTFLSARDRPCPYFTDFQPVDIYEEPKTPNFLHVVFWFYKGLPLSKNKWHRRSLTE